jgi:hypothetical protein
LGDTTQIEMILFMLHKTQGVHGKENLSAISTLACGISLSQSILQNNFDTGTKQNCSSMK